MSEGVRITLAEAIARELEAEIESGRPAPGQRIGTKDELRRRFGVAAATMNEAVRLVETRGLLVPKPGPGGGLFATEAPARMARGELVLEAGSVGDYHALRNALEPVVCRDAAAHRRAPDVRDLRAAVRALGAEVDDPVGLMRETWALHRRIARICRNTPVHSVYLTVAGFLEQAVGRATVGRGGAQEYVERHAELVEAIAEGCGPRLEAAIARHERGVRLSRD
jgi:DNA-binding FadR family transcriptional regulator